MTLPEPEFERLAEGELRKLVEALDELGDEIDPELQMGVLTIAFEDGSKYVVNSHRAARQIWMAADRRAWHFDYDPDSGRWVTDDAELWSALSSALGERLGQPVQLEA